MDPDSEIITTTVVTPGNAGDASVAVELIDDLLAQTGTDGTGPDDATNQPTTTASTPPRGGGGGKGGSANKNTAAARTRRAEARQAARQAKLRRRRATPASRDGRTHPPTVYGDAAYGTGEFLDQLAEHDIDSRCKTQPPTAAGGRFTKDRFVSDLDADTVTCPAGVTVAIRRHRDGAGTASFADACTACPLRADCTNAGGGRTIRVGRYEQRLADARSKQQDPDWVTDYRATRPTVERKLGHLMRRKPGGRRARVRGRRKVDADFSLLAAAQNLARLAVLGLRSTMTGWATITP